MFKTIIIGVLCCAAGMVVQRHFDYTQLKEVFAELESDWEKTRGERTQRLRDNQNEIYHF